MVQAQWTFPGELFLIQCCVRPDAMPTFPADRPRELRYDIGGFFSGSLTLEWDGTRLWRQRRGRIESPMESRGWEELLPPSGEAWVELHQALQDAEAWRWPRRSVDLDVMDGTEWELAFRWGSRRWKGRGSNAYPPGFDHISGLLERMAVGRRRPGIPAAFRFEGACDGQAWRFAWDGRRLETRWEESASGASEIRHREGISSRDWRPFRAALKLALQEASTLEDAPRGRWRFQSGLSPMSMGVGGADQMPNHWREVLAELKALSPEG